jgi:acyl transferase domain-containing protein/NADPH:quinone reductase-like Zn-dependent oxidoreductase/acyl carrier protein
MDKFAIIGYSHILPNNIKNDDELWEILYNRKVSKSDVSVKYGNCVYKDDNKSLTFKIANKYESIILNDEEYKFNSNLFSVSNTEAENMDIKQSMMLKCCWETLEKAGISINDVKNEKIGVFVGTQEEYINKEKNVNNMYSISGSSTNMISNRISYSMNLTGPSMTVMTACSSSIHALKTCMNSIINNECYAGFVGGVNYNSNSNASIGFSKSEIISPTGSCNSFDENANGYIRAEGCISFLIKRLDMAIQDKNKIYAVISSCCVNSTGSANVNDNYYNISPERNIVTPTFHSLIDVMTKTINMSNLSKNDIDYIEAHSTGTQIGDINETRAINNVFCDKKPTDKIKLSSIKSNLGHMEAASFVMSLLKIILMIKNKTYLPVSENFKTLNPKIQLDNVEVLTKPEKFTKKSNVFLINNYGFGGSNGCCIVEEYENDDENIHENFCTKNSNDTTNYLIPLSAKNTDDLVEYVSSLVNTVKNENISIYDIASNLSLKRTHYEKKHFIVANTINDFVDKCENIKISNNVNDVKNNNSIAFLFAGQGSQQIGCGKFLYETNDIFKKTIDYINDFWMENQNISLKNILFGATEQDEILINYPKYSQPIIFMIQISLIEYYKSWGIEPKCVIGHSFGEFACLYISKILELDEILKILVIRSNIQNEIFGFGNMLSVNMSEEEFEDLIAKNNKSFEYDIGVINLFDSIVISTDVNTIKEIKNILDENNLFNRIIKGNSAFHSRQLDKFRDKFMSEIASLGLQYKQPKIPMISTISGELIEYCDDEYIWNNMRGQVNFYKGVLKVRDLFDDVIFLELSPTQTLKYYIKNFDCKYISALNKNLPDIEALLNSIGELYTNNVLLNFKNIYPVVKTITHKLPTHPINQIVKRNLVKKMSNDKPFLRNKIDKNTYESIFGYDTHNWLLGHNINGNSIMPFAGYLEMVLENYKTFPEQPIHIDYINCFNQLYINNKYRWIILESKISDLDDKIEYITIKSYDDLETYSNELFHCKISVNNNNIIPITNFKNYILPENVEKINFDYNKLSTITNKYYNYKNNFLVIKEQYLDAVNNIVYTKIQMDEDLFKNCSINGYLIHPCLLDGIFQIPLGKIFIDPSVYKAYPTHASNISFYNKIKTNTIYVIYKYDYLNDEILKGNIFSKTGTILNGSFTIYNEDNTIVGYIDKFYTASSRSIEDSNYLYNYTLQPKIYPANKNIIFTDTNNYIQEHLNSNSKYFHRVLEIVSNVLTENNLEELSTYTNNNYEYFYISKNEELVNNLTIKYLDNKKIKFKCYSKNFSNVHKKNFFDFIILKLDEQIDENILNDLVIDNGFIISCIPLNKYDHFKQIDFVNNTYIYQKVNYLVYNNVVSNKELIVVIGNNNGIFEKLYNHLAIYYNITFVSVDDFKNNVYENLNKIFYFVGEPEKYATQEIINIIEISKTIQNNYIDKINLWMFTNSDVNPNPKNIDLGCLFGLARSLNIELLSILTFYIIDFYDEGDIDIIHNLIDTNLEEMYVVIKNKIPYVHRFTNYEFDNYNFTNYELKIINSGKINGVNIIQKVPQEIDDNDVLIENKASSLNFRDLMVILDKLPPDSYNKSSIGKEIGMECCGIVKQIGKCVKDISEGMEVIALTKKSFSNTVCCNKNLVFPKPSNLNFSEGASVLSVYVTAYYAIVEIANLKKGDSILIHSAMGGVGQAAINISKILGLEIYTTVGTEDKKNKLLEQGIKYVFNSRSHGWKNELLSVNKNGVNAVLNSLAGKHIQLSLEALSSEGWLLEIGKMDIYNNNKIELNMFKNNIGYRAIDIDRLIIDNPQRIIKIANICLNYLKNSIYKPILYKNYDFVNYKDAFECMIKGEHCGKIVINNFNDITIKPNSGNLHNYNFDKYLTGTFIVSGGYGGIGRKIISYIASMGVSKIVLISHIKDNSIHILDKNVSPIIINEKGDVSNYDFIKGIVEKYKDDLTGIIHLAGILHDKLYSEQNGETYIKVLKPKAIGAWNFHQATIETNCNLKYFVMSSSIVSLFGNKGQTTYGAANAYLDYLNCYRNDLGLPSSSINIPVVLNTGMGYDSTTNIIDISNKVGILPINSFDLVNTFDYVMRNSIKNIVHIKIKNFYYDMKLLGYNNVGMLSDKKILSNQNLNSKNYIGNMLTDTLSKIIKIKEFDKNVLLSNYGLDSLSMVEFGSNIQNIFNIQINQTTFYRHTLNTLIEEIYNLLN